MRPSVPDWTPLRAAERTIGTFPGDAPHRLALGYANHYAIGMSSLGFQRTYELIHRRPGWQAERFFVDGSGCPRTVESGATLRQFGCIAFSVSFEEDYVHLVELLDRAGIPAWREERGPRDPLVVMGGSCATINPLPLADIVDLFALGAAENVLPDLLESLEVESSRDAVLERLADRPGFFVPAHHQPEGGSLPGKLKKLELTGEQMALPGFLPSSCLITPHTEFADKLLIEMSRGCPEKCRYCWATFGMGKFRAHPTDAILEAMERARPVTTEVGFLATAVGDHPEIERILEHAVAAGFRSSVSSIRIPAVTERVLAALHASGARSITLAPETGSDRLRWAMGKPISNQQILDKVRLIVRHGFTQLKLYFLIGLPDETMEDIQAILDLAAEVRGLFRANASASGLMGHLHLGTNILIPKPFTPWQRQPMDEERSLKRKISHLKRGVSRLPNVSLGSMSVRQAVWQTYLSKGDSRTGEAIVRAARGQHLTELLRDLSPVLRSQVFAPMAGDLRWHFLG